MKKYIQGCKNTRWKRLTCDWKCKLSHAVFRKDIYIHERMQYSVDPGQPPPPLLYTSSEPIYLFGILRTIEFVWSAVFLLFRKLKTPFWAKKQKRTELWRGSTFYARLLYFIYRKVESWRVWSFFRFWKYWKLALLLSRHQNPVFF